MAIISSDTKIPLKDIGYIIGFTWFLGSIKSDISELRLRIDGRLDIYEYRLVQVEKGNPGAGKPMQAIPSAITPRSPSITDERE